MNWAEVRAPFRAKADPLYNALAYRIGHSKFRRGESPLIIMALFGIPNDTGFDEDTWDVWIPVAYTLIRGDIAR